MTESKMYIDIVHDTFSIFLRVVLTYLERPPT